MKSSINKYHNKKVVFNNIKFDSKKEQKRYAELLLLEKANKIKNLKLQFKFVLIPSYEINGRKVKGLSYIADFFYYDVEKEKHIVEDVKGYRTEVYKIKKKLFEYFYQGEIVEI